MSSASQCIIVVGTDFSKLAGLALDQALEMATLHEGSEVHVLHVQQESWAAPTREGVPESAARESSVEEVQKDATLRVAKIPAHLDRTRIRRVVAHSRRGSPAEGIAQMAADLDADLVVVGSHGHRGLERFFLGSVAERVSRLVRCPVWIVRPKDHANAGRVPEIEPACPDCLAARRANGGAELWCARHSEGHLRPHRYSYSSDGIYASETHAYASTPDQGA